MATQSLPTMATQAPPSGRGVSTSLGDMGGVSHTDVEWRGHGCVRCLVVSMLMLVVLPELEAERRGSICGDSVIRASRDLRGGMYVVEVVSEVSLIV